MTRSPIFLLALSLSLTACSSYKAAPVDLVAIGTPAVRAADIPPDVDAHALLSLALAHDPAVAAARASLSAAEHARRSAKNLPPLSLSLTAEYSKDSDPAKPWLYGGSVGVPLDTGGRRKARITTADLAVIKARYALADAIWAARQRLYQALADLDLSGDDIRLSKAQLEQRLAYQALMQRRVTHGEEAQGLSAQAALDVSAARQTLAMAELRKTQAISSLALALNTDPATAATLTVSKATAPTLPEAQPLATLIEHSLYTRSDIGLAVADYDTAENDLRLAVAAQYPDINIAPGYTWERGAVKLPVSFSLTLPPLDGNRAAINAAQAARLAAARTLEDRVKTARSSALQAVETYRTDLATAEVIRTTDLALALDLSARTERLKSAGEADQGEALLARINALQAELTALQAERTVRADRLALEDALRQPLDPAEIQILTNAAKPTEVHP